MNCCNPRTRYIYDFATGERKKVVFPCGHCINCLHAYQDMWSVRLMEAAYQYGEVIYETLTVRPDATRFLVTLYHGDENGNFPLTKVKYTANKFHQIRKSYHNFKQIYRAPEFDEEVYRLLKFYNWHLPYIDKEEIQKWMKRARIHYKRETGNDLNCSYFITQEYGPQTSRIHFHMMLFGVNYEDYMTYFARPWRKDFGWTKPTYKKLTVDTRPDFSRMCKYVSKYCSKGVFESPLVKAGFLPKPYRLISKGLGSGYLSKDFFRNFNSEEFKKYADLSVRTPLQYQKEYNKVFDKYCDNDEWEPVDKFEAEYKEERARLDESFKNHDFRPEDYLTDDQIRRLIVYYDDQGYAHALPRYYRNKLLKIRNNEKNLLQIEISELLQSRARRDDNQGLQAVAYSMGYIIPDEYLDEESPEDRLPEGVGVMVRNRFDAFKESQAKTLAARRYAKLKNTYNRGKMNLQAPALL